MRTALVTFVVTQIAVAALVVLLHEPPRTVHAPTSIPITITVPVTVQARPAAAPAPTTAPVAVTTRPSCPPPRTDAPRAKTLAPPQDVHAVTASYTNAGWIAAWNTEHVFVSTDAGKTFARVLDGPGQVDAVTFDCYGNVAVLRDHQLGIRDGTREHWQRVPGLRGEEDDPAVLIGGGPDIVVIGTGDADTWQARLAVTPDRGATWWYRDLVDYWESSEASGYQADDGTIHVALTTADCMSDPVYWLRVKDGVVETDEVGSVGPIALRGDIALIGGREGARWKRFGEGDWHDIAGLSGEAHVVPGPLPRVVAGDAVYRIDRGRAKRTGAWRERDVASVVDRAGRVWGVGETIDGEAAWAVVSD